MSLEALILFSCPNISFCAGTLAESFAPVVKAVAAAGTNFLKAAS